MTDIARSTARPRLLYTAALVAVAALAGGCARVGGPPVHTEMVGQHTYLVVGKYTSNADPVGVMHKQMVKRADRQCPGGWTKLAESPNPHASTGGRIWKIHCAANAANRTAPAADSGFIASAPPAPAPAATASHAPAPAKQSGKQNGAPTPLLQLLTEAARRAAPDISAHAARAIAQAQLRSLAHAGITLTDASGHRLPATTASGGQ